MSQSVHSPSPHGPYGPYAPYGPAPVAPRTNVLSIVALVWGVVLFMIPIVTLVLAGISLRQIRRSGEQGRPLAIIAMVLGILASILWVVIWVAIALGGGEFHYSFSTS